MPMSNHSIADLLGSSDQLVSKGSPYKLTAFLESVIPLETHSALYNSVLPAIVECISDIAKTLRHSQHVSLVGTANAFGDDQLNVDVSAENLVRACLTKCPSVVMASSEEDPVEKASGSTGASPNGAATQEQYTIAFDPLDGSSIIAPNWTVGTIIGIWTGTSALHQVPAEKQIASVLGVYGPRTTAIVALRIPGTEPSCFEVGIGEHGLQDSDIIRPKVQLASPPFKTRYFAPANLRAAAEDPKYMDLITHFVQNRYTLRYSGGLVPDIVHALVKGHGVYLSPVTGKSKAKLRRVYELFPIALIIECAGGNAIDPVDGSDILARPAEDTDERAGLVCGTTEDVEFVRKVLVAEE
ncbi:fructose-1-6-bisphosphatase [Pseudomassariella vexata]|uniref:Fructose-1-6-bisphosphatase n=1 Tax=Pseudomassariella vexata TaxID=1141098 RepID=A0A1Y2DNG8_9PEZI|nr:fructose-1-6-bisphosphatase [Pseudomassariella vexata]ORY60790.1 fructose-1-6-bisphosphatase [Pseudomassariella vexata]